ncbi:MAG: aminotransferase class V-fold PLP-dependent enzyme [Sphingomicrobium sp.]
MNASSYQSGRHLLQLPGPTNTPLRVLEAIARPTIDHRGPEFQRLMFDLLERIRVPFKTAGPVIIFASSGTGAWEAAFVNTLSPGDHILMFETGWFSTLWSRLAQKLGLIAEVLPGDWRTTVDADAIEARLRDDKAHALKAVCVVHNETSTGVLSDIAAVRRALDRANHPALLMVDGVSSIGVADYRHDEWCVDVAVSGSQKGLMLPPGLSFNAVSEKAIAASASARLPRAYWDWADVIEFNRQGFFPYTPATNLLRGLRVALDMLEEEELDNVFARHRRAAAATRAAVEHWGLELQCADANAHSPGLTAVRVPEGVSADALRAEILKTSNVALGGGLGQIADRVFRIGHMGDFSDAATFGTIACIEAAMRTLGVPHKPGGVQAAIEVATSFGANVESV